MTNAERIEAAAKAISVDLHGYRYDLAPAKEKRIAKKLATKALRAGYPELHAEPPTAWIAPWEVSEEVEDAGWVAMDSAGTNGWVAMRDAHLRTGEGKR